MFYHSNSHKKKDYFMPEKAPLVYCSYCGKNVTWHSGATNHRLHFYLTLMTLGFWSPMWLLFSLLKVKYCDNCSSPLCE